MARKVVITCPVNGGDSTIPGMKGNALSNPAIPITPAQIAQSSIEAARAGAAMVHVHVRDPKTGKGSMDLELYRETVTRIRDSGCDVILNLTTGAGAMFYPSDDEPRRAGPATTLATTAKRIEHVEALRPDMASLAMGSVNKGGALYQGGPVYLNSEKYILDCLARFRKAGVKPELDVSDAGQIVYTRALIDQGLIDPNPVFQLCLGWPSTAPATPETIVYMKGILPPDAIWLAFGRGLSTFPVAAMSIMLGGNVRIGLEDTPWISEGKLARSNAEMVDRIVDLASMLGAEPATPAEARTLLALPVRERSVSVDQSIVDGMADENAAV